MRVGKDSCTYALRTWLFSSSFTTADRHVSLDFSGFIRFALISYAWPLLKQGVTSSCPTISVTRSCVYYDCLSNVLNIGMAAHWKSDVRLTDAALANPLAWCYTYNNGWLNDMDLA